MGIYHHPEDTGTNKPTNEFLVNYGVTDALAPFPLHHLVNTMTATINRNIVSMNVQKTLPILLRLLDQQELAKYNGMTPTTLDFLGNYLDAIDGCPFVIDEQQNTNGTNRRPVIHIYIYAWSCRNGGCGWQV